MPFQDGNQDAAYSIEEIKELAKQYCEHLSQGLSKQSFVECCYKTIESRIEKEPDVFQSEKKAIDRSLRASRLWWESIGKDNILNTETTVKDSEGNFQTIKTSLNSAAWIFNMKNRFKDEWKDKQETEISGSVGTVLMPKPVGENDTENS